MLNKTYIVESILSSQQSWERVFNQFYNGLIEGIENQELRDAEIEFKFYSNTRKKYTLRYINFITNLIMWQPFISLKPTMDESYIFDCSNITASGLSGYFNGKIIYPHKRHVTNKEMNALCCDVISNLKRINEDFSIILGISLNVKSDIDLIRKNQEYADIVYGEISPSTKSEDAEALGKARIKRLMEIIKETPEHCLYPTLNAGDGINVKQFQQYNVFIGPMTDGQGGIYPRVVGTSFLNGMNSAADYFVESTSGRNAQIINKIQTGKTGFFARKLDLLCLDTSLHPDPHFVCDTVHLIPLEIRDDEFLFRLLGTNFKYHPDDTITHTVTKDSDDLIGRTIHIYSPVTCNSDKICHRCYGELSFTNNDIAVGGIAAKLHSAKITQKMLSAKHQLSARTKSITWSEHFDEFFTIDGNWIIAGNNLDFSKYNIVMDPEHFVDSGDFDEDDDTMSDDDVRCVTQFTIVNKKNPSEFYEITTDDETPIYLAEQVIDYINEKGLFKKMTDLIEIDLDKLDSSLILFLIVIENNELSATFNNIKNILDSKSVITKYDLNGAVQAFCDALIEGDMYVNYMHSFTIFRNLIRDERNILERPNFAKEVIYSTNMDMTTALLNHPSPLITLSFQDLKRRFATVTMFKKSKPSVIDALYFRTIGDMEEFTGVSFPDSYTREPNYVK